MCAGYHRSSGVLGSVMTHPEPCLCGDVYCAKCYGSNALEVCPICGKDSDECDDYVAHVQEARDMDAEQRIDDYEARRMRHERDSW